MLLKSGCVCVRVFFHWCLCVVLQVHPSSQVEIVLAAISVFDERRGENICLHLYLVLLPKQTHTFILFCSIPYCYHVCVCVCVVT